jgi:hypothetical protein
MAHGRNAGSLRLFPYGKFAKEGAEAPIIFYIPTERGRKTILSPYNSHYYITDYRRFRASLGRIWGLFYRRFLFRGS